SPSAVSSSDEPGGDDSSTIAPTSYREGSSEFGSGMGRRSASVGASSLDTPATDVATVASVMSIPVAKVASSVDNGRCDACCWKSSAGRGGTAASGIPGTSNGRGALGSKPLTGGTG